MHELGIANSVLEAVQAEAARRPGAVAARLASRVGELAGVDPDALAFSFEALTAGTEWQQLVLEIETRPRMHRCSHMRASPSAWSITNFACPGMRRIANRMRRRRRTGTGIPGNGGTMNRVPLEKKVLSENDRIAGELRERFREHGVLCLNLISSPGAGKTLLLERTLESFAPGTRVAVLTGDIQTDNDARRAGALPAFPVRQITTGGACHLDARMIERALADWRLEDLDLLLIENVGNLVCPCQLRSGRSGQDRGAQRGGRRRQAAQISVHLLQVGAAGAEQNRSAAVRAVRICGGARERPPRSSRHGDHGGFLHRPAKALDAWHAWLEKRRETADRWCSIRECARKRSDRDFGDRSRSGIPPVSLPPGGELGIGRMGIEHRLGRGRRSRRRRRGSQRLPAAASPLRRLWRASTDARSRRSPRRSAAAFEIRHSAAGAEQFLLVPPDIATCDDCRADFTRPGDRRFGYPFTNCTNCGPRYTIIRDIPYDRPMTTMAPFRMCPDCERRIPRPAATAAFTPSPTPARVCGPRLALDGFEGADDLARIREAAQAAARRPDPGHQGPGRFSPGVRRGQRCGRAPACASASAAATSRSP